MMDAGPTLDNSRHGRGSLFERSSFSRPSISAAVEFDLGRSAWNSSNHNNTIWGTNPSFRDTFENDKAKSSPGRQMPSRNFTQSRNTTTSQISPTEQPDENGVTSKMPWNSTLTAVGSMSRQRAMPLSPTKQRQNHGPESYDDPNDTLDRSSLFVDSDPDVDDGLPSFQQTPQQRHPTTSYRNVNVYSPTTTNKGDPQRHMYPSYSAYTQDYSGSNLFGLSETQNTGHQSSAYNGGSTPNGIRNSRPTQNGFSSNRRAVSNMEVESSRPNPTSRQYGTLNGLGLATDQAEQYPMQSTQRVDGIQRSLQSLSIEQARHSTEFVPARRPTNNAAPFVQEAGSPNGHGHASKTMQYPGSDISYRSYPGQVSGGTNGHRLDALAMPHYGGIPYTTRGNVPNMPADQRSNVHSPYFSATDTPPTGPDSMRSTSGSGISSHTSHPDQLLLDHKLRNLEAFCYDHNAHPMNPMLSQTDHTTPYDLTMAGMNMRLNPHTAPYMMPNYSSVSTYPSAPRMSIREPDQSLIARSQLLEDFRMNSKMGRRFELKDIYNHVVEFSGDQHGSRFIQQKLETANSDEKEQIFKEIQPNLLQLMTDVFGNYVIQKMFEHGNQSQKKVLANQMKGHVLTLSMQMYGCRVVQKAFEYVLTDQQATLVKELDGPNFQILKVVKDQNGNHVIQKAIERIPGEHIQFIVDAHRGQAMKMSTHQYGCRVVQRMLEHCQPRAKRVILDELLENIQPLILDAYGNYVVQHIIERGELHDRRRIVNIVLSHLVTFSKHKFASNIVEKSIEFADADQREAILKGLTAPDAQGITPVFGLMRDQYGNYVLQKVHKTLKGAELAALDADMRAHYQDLRRTSYGKQVAAIEKLLYGGSISPSGPNGGQSSVPPSANASITASTTATPREGQTGK